MPRRTQPHLLRASFRPDAEIDESVYPFNIPAVAEIGLIDFHPNVTFFVGENGSGKSTVLEALAVAMGFGAEGGTKSVRLLWRQAAAWPVARRIVHGGADPEAAGQRHLLP